MVNNTCKDCPDREVGCHSTCEKYKKWKEEHDRVKAIWLKDVLSRYRVPKKKVRGRDVWKPYQ